MIRGGDKAFVNPGDQPNRVGQRFAVEGVLGRGGMAVVYLVRDETTGAQVALKQLRCEKPALVERVTSLLQQEYATLSELAHPNIVKVFDYGVGDDGPYYTMELLDGDDLQRISRLEWREVCAVLRDVASALALVHSRRLVHRDVTPRNVRRMSGGRAKLIDFGALAPMGESGLVIGTPPFVPPELLHGQPVDGRADLYSLGAMAYRLLTGRHAFPARAIPELPEKWESAPPPIEGVPPNLNALVLSLLSLDVLARPSTAWEVISRLTVIADLPPEDERGAEHAYLVTPQLVGREHERAQFQDALRRAREGRGSVVWTLGDPGMGRSRLLASFALDARLAGVPVLRVSGDESDDQPFAALRSFLDDLKAFGHADTLAAPQAFDVERDAEAPREERERSRTHLRAAWVQWLATFSSARGLVIVVDDPQRLESASATLLGELVHVCASHKVVLALAVCADDGPIAVPWISLLQQHAEPMVLATLDESQVEALMRSMFGHAEHLRPLATTLHRVSMGNPGACIGLAQHLLEQGDVRYELGRWLLPTDAQGLNLPDDLTDALARRFSRLRPVARDLANALALVDPLCTIRAHHYAALLPEAHAPHFYSALAELISANIVRARGETFVISHPTLAHALQHAMGDAGARPIHLRLANLYAADPYQDLFMQAWHLHKAGLEDVACEILIKHAAEVNAPDQVARGVAARSRGYYRFARSVYEASLAYCERTQAPARSTFELRRALVYLAAYLDPQLVCHATPLIEQLRADTGLVHWNAPDMPAEPQARLMMCLSRAAMTHESLSPEARCCAPAEAVRVLAQIVSVLAGAHSRMLNVSALETLPPLIDPLRPLAPPLHLIGETVRSCLDACLGLETTQRCMALITEIEASPETRGDEITLAIVHALRYYVGVWQARHGGDDGLRRAADIEQDVIEWEGRFPYHTGLGRYRSWHVRRLSHLYNGNVEDAQQCRERIELLQLDGLDPLVTPNLQTGIYMEARAHALVGSLGELRGAIDVIEKLAAVIPTWEPVMHWAHGEYHKLREDYVSARESFGRALRATTAGRSVVWSWAASAAAETELLAGDPRRALTRARDALQACAAIRVPLLTHVELERVRLLAEAQLTSATAAGTELDALLARVTPTLGGVPLGRLHEARAQIAVVARDVAAFDHHAQRVDDIFRPGRHPALVARIDKLQALRRTVETTPTHKGRAVTLKLSSRDGQKVAEVVHAAMGSCVDYADAANNALALLMDHAAADAGYLLTFHTHSFDVSARIDAAAPSHELITYASALADGNLSETTLVSTGRQPTHHPTDRRYVSPDGAESYLPVLITCTTEQSGSFGVVVMLRLDEKSRPRIPTRMTDAIAEQLVARHGRPSTQNVRST